MCDADAWARMICRATAHQLFGDAQTAHDATEKPNWNGEGEPTVWPLGGVASIRLGSTTSFGCLAPKSGPPRGSRAHGSCGSDYIRRKVKYEIARDRGKDYCASAVTEKGSARRADSKADAGIVGCGRRSFKLSNPTRAPSR